MDATTAELVAMLHRRRDQIPASATQAARRLVLDVLGVAVAGSATVEGGLVVDAMRAAGKYGESPVPVAAERFDVATSALVMATMAYSIGLTDTHSQSITHPGPSIVPAALVLSEKLGASDADTLTAIVLGVEAVVRIGAVVNPSHRARGFHPTATCNPFGVAVTAASLLELDRLQTLWAMGLAGSMAGGLYEFRNEGAMLMALHGGLPAHSGIVSAYLAAAGFTGPTTVLEGAEGFFRGFADTVRPEMLLPAPDAPFGIEEVGLRPYNACRYAHSGIDALQRIRKNEGDLDPEAIEEIVVFTHRTAVEQESEPVTLVAARLSTCFNIALAVLYGPRLDEVTQADLADERVRALTARTRVEEDPELTAIFPAKWACRVEIRLRDGRRFTERVDVPKGEPSNPMTDGELREKFHRLADPVIGVAAADGIAETVLDPGATTALRGITRRLVPDRAGKESA